MTADEFTRWKDSFFAAFPGTLEWLNKTSPDPAATLGFWFKSLTKTDYGDALEAIDRLLDGRAAPIQAFDRDKTAIIVASVAARCFADRTRESNYQRQVVESQKPRGKYQGWARAVIVALGEQAKAKNRGESGRAVYDAVVLDELRKCGEHGLADEYEESCKIRRYMAEPVSVAATADESDEGELDPWRPT